MNNSLYQIIVIQFKSFFREPAILFWAVLFPILMAWVLGIAFTEKGEGNATVYFIYDLRKSRSLEKERTETFGKETGNPVKVKFLYKSKEEALEAVKKGEISLFIEEKGDSLIYNFDPANAEVQLTHLLIDKGWNKNASRSRMAALTTRGTRYIDFLIPGLIALGIMNTCLWGIGWNLIELRMKKLLRRMVATPMKKSTFMFALMITRIILSGFESVLLFLFAYMYFDMQLEGSLLALLLIYLGGIFAFSGIAIIVASRTSSSQVGNGLINFVSLPMMVLSGIFFNYHNFPDWAMPVIKSMPLTVLADSIRSIFIEGYSVTEILIPLLILFITGAITYIIGLRIFKWY
ncbi:MAG: ABC transporter permease [Cytophagaceae bacterium]|nr:ABC transporter permease [Cytophagaceae bacterium]